MEDVCAALAAQEAVEDEVSCHDYDEDIPDRAEKVEKPEIQVSAIDLNEFFGRKENVDHQHVEHHLEGGDVAAAGLKAAQNYANDKIFAVLNKRAPLEVLDIDSINDDVDESIVDKLLENEQRREEEEKVRAEQDLSWYMSAAKDI